MNDYEQCEQKEIPKQRVTNCHLYLGDCDAIFEHTITYIFLNSFHTYNTIIYFFFIVHCSRNLLVNFIFSYKSILF